MISIMMDQKTSFSFLWALWCYGSMGSVAMAWPHLILLDLFNIMVVIAVSESLSLSIPLQEFTPGLKNRALLARKPGASNSLPLRQTPENTMLTSLPRKNGCKRYMRIQVPAEKEKERTPSINHDFPERKTQDKIDHRERHS